jgi:tetratricopeptide (TPR) repeat protein
LGLLIVTLGALGLVGSLSGAARAAPEAPFWLRAAGVPEGAGEPRTEDEAADRATWVRLGHERTKQGRYDAAAKAYGAAITLGAADPAVYMNLAEVLMAEGRLAEAEARYRDAIAVASALAVTDPRAFAQDLALASYGLAVALDRDEQPVASHEMMGRALALDPPTAVVKVAALSNDDLRFVPDGDVYYTQALAAQVAGRRADAVEAFRQFLIRKPGSRWVRVAERHIVELTRPRATLPDVPSPRGPRLLATGTVLATGGLPAPLIDAAWRDQASILDGCLDTVAELASALEGVRFAIEIDIDGRGHIAAVTAKVPSPPGEPFASCVEASVKSGLRLRRPVPARAAHARTELIIGFPRTEGAGYR